VAPTYMPHNLEPTTYRPATSRRMPFRHRRRSQGLETENFRWSGAGSNRRPSAFQVNHAKRCADLRKRTSLTSETALGGRCKIHASRTQYAPSTGQDGGHSRVMTVFPSHPSRPVAGHLSAPNTIFNCEGYRGREVEPGSGEEALNEAVPVLHAPEPGLGQCLELRDVALDQVGQGALQVRPDRLDRVELGGIRRELEDRQPVPGRDQRAHRLADMGVSVSQTKTSAPPSCWCAASSSRA
jgi:hypothetical protein